MTAVEYREQIEDLLGRCLEPSDLVVVRTFDDLTDAQLAIVEWLAPRHVILPLHYLRAVVPDAPFKEIREFSERTARRVREGMAERTSSTELSEDVPNLPLFSACGDESE